MAYLQLAPPSDEEAHFVKELFGDIHGFFLKNAFRSSKDPILCEIHELFQGKPFTTSFRYSDHNCLGCNFADSIWMIDAFLRTHEQQQTIQYSHSTYLILLYLLVERMDTVFDLIQLHEEIRTKSFSVLTQIRKWANFIKHPKAFILCHHPVFTTPNAPRYKELHEHAKLRINAEFLQKYYTGNAHDKELYDVLENQERVAVILPNIAVVTKELCEAMNRLVELLRDNKVFRELLADRTTFTDYWNDLPIVAAARPD